MNNTVIVNRGPFDGDPDAPLYFWCAEYERWTSEIERATLYREDEALNWIKIFDPGCYILHVDQASGLKNKTDLNQAARDYLILRVILSFDFELTKERMNVARLEKVTISELMRVANLLLNKAFHEGEANAMHLKAIYNKETGDLKLAYVPAVTCVNAKAIETI